MSGGRFNYSDTAARWQVQETLEADIAASIEREQDDYEKLIQKHAKLLHEVSEVMFEWLHNYDYAASYDTSFKTLDKQVVAHLERLREVIGDEQGE